MRSRSDACDPALLLPPTTFQTAPQSSRFETCSAPRRVPQTRPTAPSRARGNAPQAMRESSALHRYCARLRATRASATGCVGRRWRWRWRCGGRGWWRGVGSQPSSEHEVKRGGPALVGVGERAFGSGVELVGSQAAFGRARGGVALVNVSEKVLGRWMSRRCI
jgi:hypothetical protein